MLSKNNILNAAVVAEQLRSQGILLRPLDNSPLQELFDASIPLSQADFMSTEQPLGLSSAGSPLATIDTAELLADMVSYATENRDTENGVESQHSIRVRALADQLATVVNANFSMARNTVVPEIEAASKAFQDFVQVVRCEEPGTEFKILQGRIPTFLKDEAFLSRGLENYRGESAYNDYYGLKVMLAPQDVDALAEKILNQGSDRLNKLVQDWLKTAPYRLIQRMLLSNFITFQDTSVEWTKDVQGRDTNQPETALMYYSFSTYKANSENGYNQLHLTIGYYLIADWLYNNPQPMSSSQKEVEYREMMDQARIVSGTLINRLVRRVELAQEGNVLVTEYNPQQKYVYVNGAMYDSWLKTPNACPEVLLGFLVGNRQLFDVNVISENIDVGCRMWELFTGIQRQENEVRLKGLFASFVRSYMYNDLVNNLKETKDNIAPESARELIMKKVDEEIAHFAHRILDDLDHLALHLVAKAKYYYTAAYTILSEMQEVARKNPDIDPREAATLSLVNYMAEYLEFQLEAAQVK
jgi:hypothetical protein